MEVLKRVDRKISGGVIYTWKLMENGEERARLKYPDGSSLSKTKASDWEITGEVPWQDSHYHKGLTERYVLLKGKILVISNNPYGLKYGILDIAKQEVAFEPGIEHIVLLSPGAMVKTYLRGDVVVNSDRKDNDWWPAGEYFISQSSKIINSLNLQLSNLFG